MQLLEQNITFQTAFQKILFFIGIRLCESHQLYGLAGSYILHHSAVPGR
jgi:hypothetical protein